MNVFNKQTGRKEEITLKNGIDRAIKQIFQSQAPHRSGTLKGQIRIERTKVGFNIVSDIYYMPYTTERWGYNKRWKAVYINPNEGWWKDAFDISMRFLSSVYGKEFKRES